MTTFSEPFGRSRTTRGGIKLSPPPRINTGRRYAPRREAADSLVPSNGDAAGNAPTQMALPSRAAAALAETHEPRSSSRRNDSGGHVRHHHRHRSVGPPTHRDATISAYRAPARSLVRSSPAHTPVSPGQSVVSSRRSRGGQKPPAALEYLIPAVRPPFADKLVVVLDLDETLVSTRNSGVYVRPGVDRLLQVLQGNCELVVWTAGTREYALEVIRMIDPGCAIQHCIYRHPMWWTREIGCTKDLRLLGRPLPRTILIDNTPDVFRANLQNSLLVSNFLGNGAADRVLFTIADIFEQVFRRFPMPVVADVLASRRIRPLSVPLDNNRAVKIPLHVLVDDNNILLHQPVTAVLFETRYRAL